MIKTSKRFQPIGKIVNFPKALDTNSIENVGSFSAEDLTAILDRAAPGWEFSVKKIERFDSIITVTASLSIGAVTRDAIGTGFANDPEGIKFAEHNALLRATKKFGLSGTNCLDIANDPSAQVAVEFPKNPLAVCLADMISTKQLSLIKSIAASSNINVAIECKANMKCEIAELSKEGASALIAHLRNLETNSRENKRAMIQRAG